MNDTTTEIAEGTATGTEEVTNSDNGVQNAEPDFGLLSDTDANTPEDTEAADTRENEDGLILGKYKTHDELERAYKELEKMKAPAKVPDEYEFEEGFLENSGLVVNDENNFNGIMEDFKNHGITQDQANYLLGLYGQTINAYVANQGPQVNREAELKTLEGEWGKDANERIRSVASWSRTNLPADVLTRPLAETAEGIKFLESMMANQRGPSPMTDAAPKSTDPITLKGELESLVRSSEYKGTGDKARALQKRAQEIAEKLDRLTA